MRALTVETVCNLDFEDLHAWLINSQVGHLHIKTVEVDALETLIDSRGEPSLANLLNANLVVQSTELMELTEKRVELEERARVASPSAPERAASKRTVLSLEFIDDLVEVPGEGQDVGVLLLRELSINSESGIFRGNINLASLLLSLGNDCSV